MYLLNPTRKSSPRQAHRGFTLIELLIATAILLVVSAVVLSLMFQMSMTQASINNRTEMHSSVRSVTEVMQQEISQAGRIAIQGPNGASGFTTRWTTLSANVAANATTMTVASAAGLFVGEILEVQDNTNTIGGLGQETVDVGSIAGTTITLSGGGQFQFAHNFGATVRPSGSFSSGIIPPDTCPTVWVLATCPSPQPALANGSTGYKLKLIGDINDDGTIAYVEYDCNPGTSAAPGTLTRMQLDALTGTAAQKAAAVASPQILLNNVLTNPLDASGNAVPCFSYQLESINLPPQTWFVVDVSVTLTAQTPFQNPNTHQWDEGTKETKALLNISPRNVFQAWRMVSSDPIPGNPYAQPAVSAGLTGQVPSNVYTALMP